MVKLTPKFSKKDIVIPLAKFMIDKQELMQKALNRIGLEIVKEARINTKIVQYPKIYPHEATGFYDDTANLRASIGYVLLFNGKIIEENFIGKPKGVEQGKKKGLQTAKKYQGWVLTVIAGMNYAITVEAKGYDVISNSIPLKSAVTAKLKLLIGAK